VAPSAQWWDDVTFFAFQGESALTIDGKSRVVMPSRHRDALAAICRDELTITKHPKGCLVVFPRPEWERFRNRLMELPLSADDWRRLFIGGAVDVKIDGSSRVLITPELKRYAGIERDVVLLGMGTRLELWNEEAYLANEAKTRASEMPESIQNFVM
jgi:MraZ protein